MVDEVLHTKWGTAKLNSKGKYHITSAKEGYAHKYLHRLIWEEYYGKIPEGMVIHHINGIGTDNRIENLQMMTHAEHSKLHSEGENNAMFGKKASNETKMKMSKARRGKDNPRCRWDEVDIAGGISLLKWYKNKLNLKRKEVLKLHSWSGKMLDNYFKNNNLKWSEL